MTEQEIVSYLKENKTKGIAFAFMPNRVREWAEIHCSDIFMIYSKRKWEEIAQADYVIENDDIICLPDNYELKKLEKTGEWVEFEIDEGGNFEYNSIRFTGVYYWWDWQKFLTDANDNGLCFTDFGGYLYAGCNDWFMTPRIFYNNRLLDHYQKIEIDGKIVKPAIPVKIRFWREIK